MSRRLFALCLVSLIFRLSEAQCGNGIVEVGESCDPPGSSFCTNGQVCRSTCNCYGREDCNTPLAPPGELDFEFLSIVCNSERGTLLWPLDSAWILVVSNPDGLVVRATPVNCVFEEPFGNFCSAVMDPAPGEPAWSEVTTEGSIDSLGPFPWDSPVSYSAGIFVNFRSSSVFQNCQDPSFPFQVCQTDYGWYMQTDRDFDPLYDGVMEVVVIDKSTVALNWRILFVPLLWTSSQADFDQAAFDQVKVFTNATTLRGCEETIDFVTLDVNTQNFAGFMCNQDSCRLSSITAHLRSLGIATIGYDLIAGLLPNGASPCSSGCSNTVDTIFAENAGTSVFVHEIGHIYGLEDEYCSEEVGGFEYCAGPSGPNRLDPALGCDPMGGCCFCGTPGGTPGDECGFSCDPSGTNDNYRGCCFGNLAPDGTRCIMSSSGQNFMFCQHCQDHLDGKIGLLCDVLPSSYYTMLLSIELTVNESSKTFQVNAVESGMGRATRSLHAGGQFRVELDGLLDVSFEYKSLPRGQQYDYIRIKSPVPPDFDLDSSPPSKLKVFKNGKQFGVVTLFGQTPNADAGPDITKECTSPSGALVELDGSRSSDPDGDSLTYMWMSTADMDDPTGVSPSGWFPLGTSQVSLVVSDGVAESSPDQVSVTVIDTKSPTISLNGAASVTLECNVDTYTELGATAADVCDPSVSVMVGGDSVDTMTVKNYVISYEATDDSGNTAVDSREVSVVDTRAPAIQSISARPNSLWPPNHKMATVAIDVVATDECTPDSVSCSIVNVSTNEDISGPGNPHHPDWILGDEPLMVQLRKERSGKGKGRIYTITVSCSDDAGNISTLASVDVAVAHDGRGDHNKPSRKPGSGEKPPPGKRNNKRSRLWD